MSASDHPSHAVLARKLQDYLRWRNANARHPDVLAAQGRERAASAASASNAGDDPKRKPHDPAGERIRGNAPVPPRSPDPGRGPPRGRFSRHAHDRVTTAADDELSVGPRRHLALGARWQYDGIAGPEHQLPGVDRDLGFPLEKMPDLLGVKDMQRALLAGPHLDQPHAKPRGRAL
jgi:hypothetical protein